MAYVLLAGQNTTALTRTCLVLAEHTPSVRAEYLAHEDADELRRVLSPIPDLYARRNRVIHADWWQDPEDGGTFGITTKSHWRRKSDGRFTSFEEWTLEQLSNLSDEFIRATAAVNDFTLRVFGEREYGTPMPREVFKTAEDLARKIGLTDVWSSLGEATGFPLPASTEDESPNMRLVDDDGRKTEEPSDRID